VTYLVASLGVAGFGATPQRLRVRARVPGDDPRLPTVSDVWPAANWPEREAYDLFGITFDGHPDLRRILMPDDWDGFPLRKDYPVQIKAPVKTYAPLQLSAEEFVANVEAARDRAHATARNTRGGDPGAHPTAHNTRGGDPDAHPTAHNTRGGDPGAKS
jgi:NADH-quinone oxidoreductase subunit C